MHVVHDHNEFDMEKNYKSFENFLPVNNVVLIGLSPSPQPSPSRERGQDPLSPLAYRYGFLVFALKGQRNTAWGFNPRNNDRFSCFPGDKSPGSIPSRLRRVKTHTCKLPSGE
jgi:hypothetical protein